MVTTVKDAQGTEFKLQTWSCPICKVEDEKKLGFRGGRFHRYSQGVETQIVQCRRCGLLYSNPFPVPCDAQELYGDPATYFAAQDETRKLELSQDLLKEVVLRSVAKPRIVDVGAGRGEVVAAGKLQGIDVLGLEFSSAMIAYAQQRHGAVLQNKAIEQLAIEQPSSFDAVILNAVLEHVYDPDSMIRSASELLRPGGIVYIDVPNEPNLLTHIGNTLNKLMLSQAVYNLSPTWPPYHVYGFNPQALKIALTKYSLQLESLRIFAAPTIRSNSHLKDRAKAFIAGNILKLANLTGTSSNMIAWARKEN